MSVNIEVFNALGLIPGDVLREVRAGIEDGVEVFRHHCEVEHVGISLHDSGFVTQERGFGGMSYGPQSFALYVDPSCDAIRTNVRVNAAATTVHELHHCLRQRTRPLRPYSQMCAGDVLVLEGLAVSCEAFLGYEGFPGVVGVTNETLQPLIDRVAPAIGDPKADWNWIYENNGLKHPALYAMGNYLVSPYLAKMNTDPIRAINVPWREFWNAFSKASAI